MNERYLEIIDKIDRLEAQLESSSLTELQRKVLEHKLGDLTDELKRMTFNISTVEEDNYEDQ